MAPNSNEELRLSKVQTEYICDLYKEADILWDMSSPKYSKRDLRTVALSNIAKQLKEKYPELNPTVDHVWSKLQHLRTYYNKELKRTIVSERNSSEPNDIYISPWCHYKSLDSFLRSQVVLRKELITHPIYKAEQYNYKRKNVDPDEEFLLSRLQTNFLCDLYEEEDVLWDINSPGYSKKDQRNAALNNIATKLKETFPRLNPTVNLVWHKIQHLRTYYNKELKRTNDSKKSSSGPNDIYKSPWCHYKSLDSFLRKQIVPRKPTISNNQWMEDQPEEESDDSRSQSSDQSDDPIQTSSRSPRRKRKLSTPPESDISEADPDSWELKSKKTGQVMINTPEKAVPEPPELRSKKSGQMMNNTPEKAVPEPSELRSKKSGQTTTPYQPKAVSPPSEFESKETGQTRMQSQSKTVPVSSKIKSKKKKTGQMMMMQYRTKEDDEDDIFGKHVANEMRKIRDEKAKGMVKIKIQTALFEAQQCQPQMMFPHGQPVYSYSADHSHCNNVPAIRVSGDAASLPSVVAQQDPIV